jgi:hypothetical protein
MQVCLTPISLTVIAGCLSPNKCKPVRVDSLYIIHLTTIHQWPSWASDAVLTLTKVFMTRTDCEISTSPYSLSSLRTHCGGMCAGVASDGVLLLGGHQRRLETAGVHCD